MHRWMWEEHRREQTTRREKTTEVRNPRRWEDKTQEDQRREKKRRQKTMDVRRPREKHHKSLKTSYKTSNKQDHTLRHQQVWLSQTQSNSSQHGLEIWREVEFEGSFVRSFWSSVFYSFFVSLFGQSRKVFDLSRLFWLQIGQIQLLIEFQRMCEVLAKNNRTVSYPVTCSSASNCGVSRFNWVRFHTSQRRCDRPQKWQ